MRGKSSYRINIFWLYLLLHEVGSSWHIIWINMRVTLPQLHYAQICCSTKLRCFCKLNKAETQICSKRTIWSQNHKNMVCLQHGSLPENIASQKVHTWHNTALEESFCTCYCWSVDPFQSLLHKVMAVSLDYAVSHFFLQLFQQALALFTDT